MQDLVRDDVFHIRIVYDMHGYSDDKIVRQFGIDRSAVFEAIALAPAVARIRRGRFEQHFVGAYDAYAFKVGKHFDDDIFQFVIRFYG